MSAENFLERTRINAMRRNDVLPVEIRELADKDINKFEMNAIPLRINNRCVITSRLVSTAHFNFLISFELGHKLPGHRKALPFISVLRNSCPLVPVCHFGLFILLLKLIHRKYLIYNVII